MTPTTKWLLKAVGVGLYAMLAALAAVRASGTTIGWGNLEDAGLAGGIGLLAFLGLAKTTLENPGSGD
jgi:hypothetical protein